MSKNNSTTKQQAEQLKKYLGEPYSVEYQYKNPATIGKMMIRWQDENRDNYRIFIIQDYLHNEVVVKWCDSHEIEVLPSREFRKLDRKGNQMIVKVHNSFYDEYMKEREPTFYHEGKWHSYYNGA